MDLWDFYETIFKAVAQDDALESWARINFGRQATVFVDFDANEAPASTDRPYVLFHTPGFDKDQERRLNNYYIGSTLVVGIDDLVTRAEGNIELPGGMELIVDFMSHVQRIIAANLPANFTVGFSAAADTMATDAEVVADMDAAFTEPVTIGTSPLA